MRVLTDEERAHVAAVAEMQGVDPSRVVWAKADPLDIDDGGDEEVEGYYEAALADRAREDRSAFEMRLPADPIPMPTRTVRRYTMDGRFISETEEPAPDRIEETVAGAPTYTVRVPLSSITGPYLDL